MKVLTRTLILLAAALVVVGITMAFQSAGMLAFADPRGFDREMHEGSSPTGFMPGGEGVRPEGFGGRREGFGHRGGGHNDDGINIFGASELVKNLVITAVIIAVFSLLSRAFRTLRPQRR